MGEKRIWNGNKMLHAIWELWAEELHEGLICWPMCSMERHIGVRNLAAMVCLLGGYVGGLNFC